MLAKTWGKLPSEIARPLFGRDLPPYVTALDWYAFDIAATARYQEMRDPPPSPASQPSRPLVQENASGLVIHGTEIPPWQR